MSSQNVKVRTGNKVKVYFDGTDVGLIQNVEMNDDYGLEPASGVGDIHAVEYTPTMARHSLSVQNMILYSASMRDKGISLENGDAALNGLVFDFILQDSSTGETLRKYSGCSFGSGNVSVQKHAILMSSGQFMALDVSGTGV